MKLFIVLALFGAAFAAPSDEVKPVILDEAPAPSVEVEPVILGKVEIPEFVDFGIAYIPESVAREVGLEQSVDEPSPVHFVNENGDIQSFVYDVEAPVDASVDEANIAPGELEAIRVVDIANFEVDSSPFQYDVRVEEPVFVDAPESIPNDRFKLYNDPLLR